MKSFVINRKFSLFNDGTNHISQHYFSLFIDSTRMKMPVKAMSDLFYTFVAYEEEYEPHHLFEEAFVDLEMALIELQQLIKDIHLTTASDTVFELGMLYEFIESFIQKHNTLYPKKNNKVLEHIHSSLISDLIELFSRLSDLSISTEPFYKGIQALCHAVKQKSEIYKEIAYNRMEIRFPCWLEVEQMIIYHHLAENLWLSLNRLSLNPISSDFKGDLQFYYDDILGHNFHWMFQREMGNFE